MIIFQHLYYVYKSVSKLKCTILQKFSIISIKIHKSGKKLKSIISGKFFTAVIKVHKTGSKL